MMRRALVFAEPGRVEVVEETLDRPPPGALRARTLVSAISAGTELLAFRGELPSDLAVDETLGALRGQSFKYPFRYGYAQVGAVEAVGAGLDATWVGRRIFAFAPHATAFIIPVEDAVPIPDDISPERAALLAHMETAVNLLLDGQPLLGENVLVIGLGTVGMLTTALLSRFPLGLLAAVDRNPHRVRAAANTAADGRTQVVTQVVTPAATVASVAAAFDPRGADLVYELSGNPEALDLAASAAAHEGRIIVGSWYGNKRALLDLGGTFHRRRLRLIASQVSHLPAVLSARWDRARRFETAWSALRELDLSHLVSERFPFAEAQRAYQSLLAQTCQQITLVHD